MKLLASKTVALTNESVLSRNKIADFFTELSETPVYPATIVKLTELLGFPEKVPIRLNEIQRIYLLGCAKQLMGKNTTYRNAMENFRLHRSHPIENVSKAWGTVRELGGLSQAEFNKKLTEFFIKTQEE